MNKECFSKLHYEAPEVTVIYLSNSLSFLKKSFSLNANGQDWNDSDLLDSELDDDLFGDDWGYGGLVGE